MLKRRRHLKQTPSVRDKLLASANEMRDRAARLPPGPEQDALRREARQADTASHIDDWANAAAEVALALAQTAFELEPFRTIRDELSLKLVDLFKHEHIAAQKRQA